ncbi:hypothetical protein [Mycobacterium phage WXIN]|nr:hypothetical protein [Mycobacterium phage WXIN]
MTIDHKTCGHVNHITLDGSRHEEIHTATLDLITKWSGQANRANATGSPIHAMVAAHLRSCVDDLVQAMRPFEVEQ